MEPVQIVYKDHVVAAYIEKAPNGEFKIVGEQLNLRPRRISIFRETCEWCVAQILENRLMPTSTQIARRFDVTTRTARTYRRRILQIIKANS